MSSKPNVNSRLDKLDRVLNSLREQERDLRRIVERFEAVLEGSTCPGGIVFPGGQRSRRVLEGVRNWERVILISGDKTLLITKEELRFYNLSWIRW
ncbi:MAG: hypothetical protein ACETVR_00955 [Candidatus Bathyarchaeia archaeon]